MIVRLDHVLVTAPPGSEDIARWFYGTLLGLPETPKPPGLKERGGVWFTVGDRQLHIGIEDAPTNEGSRRHIALVVDDLAALRARLQAEGVAVTEDDLLFPGYRRFYGHDPFGSRIEFMQALGE